VVLPWVDGPVWTRWTAAVGAGPLRARVRVHLAAPTASRWARRPTPRWVLRLPAR